MSIHLDDVPDYLDSRRDCQKAENMESLMEMLHDAYTSYHVVDNEKIRHLFAALRKIWEPLPANKMDEMFSLVCDLCVEHEVLAFSQGGVPECF